MVEPAEGEKGRLNGVKGRKATGWWWSRLGERREGGGSYLKGKGRVVKAAKIGKGR